MAKRCVKCGFTGNPDDANFCGKCGANIDVYNYQWKLYNASTHNTYPRYGYTSITNSRLRELQDYERRVKNSGFNKLKRRTSDIWENMRENWNDYMWIGGGIIVILFFIWIIFIRPPKEEIKIVKVDGKYGIGYSEEKLLVPAQYDSILKKRSNYWVLFDLTSRKTGLAYVTDSLTSIIKPSFSQVETCAGPYALIYSDDKPNFIVNEGRILNKVEYKDIETIPGICDPALFNVTTSENQHKLLDLNLKEVAVGSKGIKYFPEDSLVMVQDKDPSSSYITRNSFYDIHGNKLTSTNYYNTDDFSDGVAWTSASPNDYNRHTRTLIDRYGQPLFTLRNLDHSGYKEFSEGVGWYRKSGTKTWIAIDKSGKELFSLSADKVYPFSLGVAAVEKKDVMSRSRLGFVDKTGNTVIPFIYDTSYHADKFEKDSTIRAQFNGTKGRLHYNGKFTPQK